MKNIENVPSIINSVENRDVIEAIKEETRRERIDPNNFREAGLFDEREIEADCIACGRLEDEFEERNKKLDEDQRIKVERGLTAEYTFRHAIQEYGWLAEKINLTIASQYDDFVRGIDAIAEIKTEKGHSEHLGLAIDFASGAEDVGNKIRKTFDSIDLGYSPSVKYFKSSDLGKQKNFRVPRIVIGACPETLARLSEYSMEIMNKSGLSESVKQQLREDSFQFVLLGEITAQLSVFCNRLNKVIEQAQVENRTDIEKRAKVSFTIHENALHTILGIIKEKKVDIATIQKHIRGDIFATKMGTSLSMLSLTPIDFSHDHAKQKKVS